MATPRVRMAVTFFATPRVRTFLQATSPSAQAQISDSDKNYGKEISFVNYPARNGSEVRRTVTFGNEASFLAYLHRNDVSALEEVVGESGEGSVVTTFANLDPDKEYIICYKRSATEGRIVGIEGFARNTADSFEDRANLALVHQLQLKKHAGVELRYSQTELRLGKTIRGDIDGLVETDSHVFVVESKLHAQVCPPGSFCRPSAPSLIVYFSTPFLSSGRYAPAQ